MIKGLPNKFPLILITLIALATFWADKTVWQSTREKEESFQENPDYIMENFSAYSVDHISGNHENLLAKRMFHFIADNTTYFEQPRLINSKVNESGMRAKADKANMSGDADIYLHGNVKVIRYDNSGNNRNENKNKITTMTTSYLHINRDNDTAKTNKPVTIIQNNNIINAIGVEIDNRTQTIHLLSKVKFAHNKAH
tara:strand:+ start:1264 stop:1854 length:591 start_codon:yes stop_codon:yes gene_type:complete